MSTERRTYSFELQWTWDRTQWFYQWYWSRRHGLIWDLWALRVTLWVWTWDADEGREDV